MKEGKVKKKLKAPVAILWAFWHYIIYCDINGIWYLKELERKEKN